MCLTKERSETGAVLLEVLVCAMLAAVLCLLQHQSVSAQSKAFVVWERRINMLETERRLLQALSEALDRSAESRQESFGLQVTLAERASRAHARCRPLTHSRKVLCRIDFHMHGAHNTTECVLP